MERKRLSAEQIVTKLRQIEVLQAQGKIRRALLLGSRCSTTELRPRAGPT